LAKVCVNQRTNTEYHQILTLGQHAERNFARCLNGGTFNDDIGAFNDLLQRYDSSRGGAHICQMLCTIKVPIHQQQFALEAVCA
jgi:hypothetical protein